MIEHEQLKLFNSKLQRAIKKHIKDGIAHCIDKPFGLRLVVLIRQNAFNNNHICVDVMANESGDDYYETIIDKCSFDKATNIKVMTEEVDRLIFKVNFKYGRVIREKL